MNKIQRVINTHICLAAFAASTVAALGEPLEIWISSYQDKVYYEDMVKLYREEVNEDFQANVHAYGFREMPDKLAVAIKTGVNPPDVVQLDEVLFGTYLAGEVPFVEISDRIKEAKIDQDIVPERLSLFAYKGKTYGLPQSLSAMVLYYRTDLFEEKGITPEDITTWDAFMRKGEELADRGQAFTALDPTYFGMLLRQKGGHLFGEDGKPFPDHKETVEVLQFLQDLHVKNIGMLPDRATVFDPVFFSSTVTYGDILCIIGADWYGLDMLQQFTPELKGKWGVMPLPAWTDRNGFPGPRTSTFAGQGLMIYKDSQQIDESWEFIEFVMTNKEANVRRFVNGNSFPAYKPAWTDERMQKRFAFFNDQRLGQVLADLATEIPTVAMNPKRPQAVFMFQESFFNSLMYSQLTPDQVIKEMTKLLEGN